MRRPIGTIITGLVAAVAAAPLPAQISQRSWTLCTPNSVRSCHSIQLVTSPVMSGATRVGTNVTVNMRNLNGAGVAGDNTIWSNLYQTIFFASLPNAGTTPWQPVAQSLALTGPGASGAASWYRIPYANPGLAELYIIPVASGQGLGGCGMIGLPAYTCGLGATATLSFTTTNWLYDAPSFDLAISASGATTDGGAIESCATAGNQWGWQSCDVESMSTTVTPEPVTMVLLGSGLLGVGGARLRRRKRGGEV